MARAASLLPLRACCPALSRACCAPVSLPVSLPCAAGVALRCVPALCVSAGVVCPVREGGGTRGFGRSHGTHMFECLRWWEAVWAGLLALRCRVVSGVELRGLSSDGRVATVTTTGTSRKDRRGEVAE